LGSSRRSSSSSAVERRRAESGLLDLAEQALEDADEDYRWQAGILAGLFIPHDLGRIWKIIARFGASPDAGTREIVATVLLEGRSRPSVIIAD
jgi:hypothetical protein